MLVQKNQRSQGNSSVFPGGFFVLWGLLFGLWLVINVSLAVPVLASGLLISGAIAWIFARRSNAWANVRLTPATLSHLVQYLCAFFIELVKANINMLRYVYAPRIDIKPGIVKIKLGLQSPVGRLALANSIALTPGSLVMDIRGDVMFIHWLDVQTLDMDEATQLIAGPFEKHLEVVFG